jgi:lysophospholipase L1-like esterase
MDKPTRPIQSKTSRTFREWGRRLLYLPLVINLLLLPFIVLIVLVGYGLYPFEGLAKWLYSERSINEKNRTSLVSGSIYEIYQPPQPVEVVLLGDSIIYNVNWNELLSRSDVAGRGAQSATVAGTMERFNLVERLEPSVVFIHLGINDIIQGHSLKKCLSNYMELVRRFEHSRIRPIISAALPVSTRVPEHLEINRQVFAWNGMLKAYAEQEQLTFLDVNPDMLDNRSLRPELTYDGVHLLGQGYALWRRGIVRVLSHTQPGLSAAPVDAVHR